MFRYLLVCLMVVLVIGGVVGTASTAQGDIGDLYASMVAWKATAEYAYGTAWGCKQVAVARIGYAQYLAGLAYDPTAGNALLVEAASHMLAGNGKLDDAEDAIAEGYQHFCQVYEECQAAIDDYTAAYGYDGEARDAFNDALADADAAIATFYSTTEAALFYAITAEQYEASILEAETGTKAVALQEYNNALTAQAACNNEDWTVSGDGCLRVTENRLNAAAAAMDVGTQLYGEGYTHFLFGEWLLAVEDYDGASTAWLEAEGLYNQAKEKAEQAIAHYNGEFPL